MALPFTALAARPDARVEELALALAAEFAPVDRARARARLDLLGEEVAAAVQRPRGPAEEVAALAEVLGDRHGYAGDTESYDDPVNSRLDAVLERRRGLPITLSVLYVAVAHRAEVALAGFGLAGHFVAGHVGAAPPLLLDPFHGGARLADVPDARPWTAHETAMRMLNNLVAAYGRRGDLGAQITAAELRVHLPAGQGERRHLEAEARALRARLN